MLENLSKCKSRKELRDLLGKPNDEFIIGFFNTDKQSVLITDRNVYKLVLTYHLDYDDGMTEGDFEEFPGKFVNLPDNEKIKGLPFDFKIIKFFADQSYSEKKDGYLQCQISEGVDLKLYYETLDDFMVYSSEVSSGKFVSFDTNITFNDDINLEASNIKDNIDNLVNRYCFGSSLSNYHDILYENKEFVSLMNIVRDNISYYSYNGKMDMSDIRLKIFSLVKKLLGFDEIFDLSKGEHMEFPYTFKPTKLEKDDLKKLIHSIPNKSGIINVVNAIRTVALKGELVFENEETFNERNSAFESIKYMINSRTFK